MLKNMGRLNLGQVSRGNNMGCKGYILKVFGLTGETKDRNELNQCVPICDAIS
jgi:hypothetical protein